MADAPIQTEESSWTLSGQFSHDDTMRRLTIDSSPYTVGRRGDQSLSIPCPTVSSLHAEFELRGDSLWVRDLGSTNGSFVNGTRIKGAVQVHNGDLVQFAQIVFRVGSECLATHSHTVQDASGDRALALIQFDKLMTDRAITPFFQPIVTMQGQTIGYEVLARSPLFGLRNPQTMFMAAAVLDLEAELSRVLRIEGVNAGASLPGEKLIFANTHPAEIDDLDVLEFSLRELREVAPTRPLVLEIHEATATQSVQMRRLRGTLAELNMGLAYDDFGAGQARLVELADVPPDYLKFDMSLIQGISSATAERQKMVEHLVQMTTELGIVALAEGVEDQADHAVCTQMGFACAQGYLYGKPSPPGKL
ncbi:MAG: EAL domain-containing protein [Planctomycetota bacterium]